MSGGVVPNTLGAHHGKHQGSFMRFTSHTIVALSVYAGIILVVLAQCYLVFWHWRAKRYRSSLLIAFVGIVVMACVLTLALKSHYLDTYQAIREVERLGGRVDELGNVWLNGTDADDAILVRLQSVPEVYSLQLFETQISDAGLDELRHFPQLRGLDIRRTRATLRRVESLRLELPRCYIVYDDDLTVPLPQIEN